MWVHKLILIHCAKLYKNRFSCLDVFVVQTRFSENIVLIKDFSQKIDFMKDI